MKEEKNPKKNCTLRWINGQTVSGNAIAVRWMKIHFLREVSLQRENYSYVYYAVAGFWSVFFSYPERFNLTHRMYRRHLWTAKTILKKKKHFKIKTLYEVTDRIHFKLSSHKSTVPAHAHTIAYKHSILRLSRKCREKRKKKHHFPVQRPAVTSSLMWSRSYRQVNRNRNHNYYFPPESSMKMAISISIARERASHK